MNREAPRRERHLGRPSAKYPAKWKPMYAAQSSGVPLIPFSTSG